MKVSLTDAGKRFNRDWIFRHFTYNFEAGNSYAIIGPNGSGKSTFLQAVSGALHLNEGHIDFFTGPSFQFKSSTKESVKNIKGEVPNEEQFKYVSICAPYLELVEEMTLPEFLQFHQEFKPLLPGMDDKSIITLLGLEKAANRQIRYYSSGMKQRAKLAQCILSDTPIVLLDEPCTNLDAAGIALYHQLIETYCKDRLVLVSSNDEVEYQFCNEKINISDFK